MRGKFTTVVSKFHTAAVKKRGRDTAIMSPRVLYVYNPPPGTVQVNNPDILLGQLGDILTISISAEYDPEEHIGGVHEEVHYYPV